MTTICVAAEIDLAQACLQGSIADAIQGAKGKGSDSCTMSVDGDKVATRYFELVENEKQQI